MISALNEVPSPPPSHRPRARYGEGGFNGDHSFGSKAAHPARRGPSAGLISHRSGRDGTGQPLSGLNWTRSREPPPPFGEISVVTAAGAGARKNYGSRLALHPSRRGEKDTGAVDSRPDLYEKSRGRNVLNAYTKPLPRSRRPWRPNSSPIFQNAHITTIDSFCAEIVRQAARDFGYSPEFTIDDEKAADLAKGIAYRFVARNPRESRRQGSSPVLSPSTLSPPSFSGNSALGGLRRSR